MDSASLPRLQDTGRSSPGSLEKWPWITDRGLCLTEVVIHFPAAGASAVHGAEVTALPPTRLRSDREHA